MRWSPFSKPLTVWAVRELMRHPLENGMTAAALALLVMITGTVLLLSQSLSETTGRIMAEGPDVVIRRLDAGGWMPLPIQPSLSAVNTIPGVLNPRPRIWGDVRGTTRFFTVMGVDEKTADVLADAGITPPSRGGAVAGAAAVTDMAGDILMLTGARTFTLSVTAILPKDLDMVAHDVVLVHSGDAGELLGIPDGHATDLVLDVFHEEEAAALIPDLLAALPWRAQVLLRKDAQGAAAGGFARLGGIGLAVIFPALIALLLLLVVTVRSRLNRKAETGLLKALGWCTRDIVRLYTVQSFMVTLPATVFGLAAAYGLVFRPGINWVSFLFFGWRQTAPPLFLSAAGAGMVFVQVAACVLLPYSVTAWWAAYRAASADPADLLQGESGL